MVERYLFTSSAALRTGLYLFLSQSHILETKLRALLIFSMVGFFTANSTITLGSTIEVLSPELIVIGSCGLLSLLSIHFVNSCLNVSNEESILPIASIASPFTSLKVVLSLIDTSSFNNSCLKSMRSPRFFFAINPKLIVISWRLSNAPPKIPFLYISLITNEPSGSFSNS